MNTVKGVNKMSYKRFLKVFNNKISPEKEVTMGHIKLPVKLNYSQLQKFAIVMGSEIDKFLRGLDNEEDNNSKQD